MTLFALSGICLSYRLRDGEREILKDLTFEAAEGEVLTICGASGTGKTSLLRILAGLTWPTKGLATFRGVPIAGPAPGVAIVFQDYVNALLQWRSVARNVALGLEREQKGNERKRSVEAALKLVGLEANANDYPWQLSGGMQQRVQIARALALRPSVLLMDEPFAALDAMTKAGLQDELLRLRDRTGTSVIFITHDIEEAVYLGDRVAVLRGSPSTIAATFAVDLPQPRDQITSREHPSFLGLRHKIYDAIGMQR